MYFRKIDEGGLVFLLVTQVDNYVYTGTPSEITAYEKFLQKEFEVGELERGTFSIHGCEINQHEDFLVAITQCQKLKGIPNHVPRSIPDN